ncbi:MAG: BrnT family toxin [Candidatus Contendobacter sp.]
MHTRFEWDEAKNRSNQYKHGVSFEVASLVFSDPFALAALDRFENGEERWQTIGAVYGAVVILVAHTVQLDRQTEIIRVISARKATTHERRRYEAQAY